MTETSAAHHIPGELTARLREAHAYMGRVGWADPNDTKLHSLCLLDRAISCGREDGDEIVLDVLMQFAAGTPRLYTGPFQDPYGGISEERAVDYLTTTTVTAADLEATFGPGWAQVVLLVRANTRMAPEEARAVALKLAERSDAMSVCVTDISLASQAKEEARTPAARALADQFFERANHGGHWTEDAIRLLEARTAAGQAVPSHVYRACQAAAILSERVDAVLTSHTHPRLLTAAMQMALLAEAGRHLITKEQYAALAAPLAGAPAPTPTGGDELEDEEYELVESIQVFLAYRPGWTNGQMELSVRRVLYEGDSADDYDIPWDGEIFSGELATPAGTSPEAIATGKAEAVKKLRELGLQLWDDDWHKESDYAIFNDTKPLT
ncbi:hypothetical protein [Streptomyces cyaneofuscatus]|uniref:hypothetical protein n=1 Tax=Streptomyces cyaneofuscatus TaxID=66883 RepID=UPI0033A4F2E8